MKSNKPVEAPAAQEKQYPCHECGLLRTKAEGGTTFTVCDACWDKLHNKTSPIATLAQDQVPVPAVAQEIIEDHFHNLIKPPQEKWEPKRARKIGGSFEADGTIVSQFTTTSKQERVVFEFDSPKGMLHIYRPDQLVLAPSTDKWSPRFRVGDRVKFRTQGGGEDTIESINEDHTYFCKVSGLKWSEELLEWQLPTPPAGQQWHRTDWTQDLLPDGWRPLLRDEKRQAEDEYYYSGWWPIGSMEQQTVGIMSYLHRTKRPLPSTDNPSHILTPEELTKLCGNQPPHRTDGWKAEWLPEGMRPLLKGEQIQAVDEWCEGTNWEAFGCEDGIATRAHYHLRTTRPLPPTQPATAKTGAHFENWWFNANTKTPITEHSMAHARDGWNAAIAFASSAEKENLIAPDEGNVRYWTQRILDLIHYGGITERGIEKVIRELLEKDTHYAAAETQGVPSVDQLLHEYKKAGFPNAAHHLVWTTPDCRENHRKGISAVREACMRAKLTPENSYILKTLKDQRDELALCAEAAEQKVKQLEDAMFDKEQAINREAEAIGRAVSAEQTADALRREVSEWRERCEKGKRNLDVAKGELTYQGKALQVLSEENAKLRGERDNAIKHWNEALQLIPVPPLTEENPKIITAHVYPPIPMRHHDWCAYREGREDGLLGWGFTEDLAKADLINQEES